MLSSPLRPSCVLTRPPCPPLPAQTATFVDGELKLERYFNSFPFEHFVLLRDVEGLPAAISSILRQYFDLSQH